MISVIKPPRNQSRGYYYYNNYICQTFEFFEDLVLSIFTKLSPGTPPGFLSHWAMPCVLTPLSLALSLMSNC